MGITDRYACVALVACVAFCTVPGALAAEREPGFYLGVDIGASLPTDFESTRINNGISTNCDQWLDSDTLNNGVVAPLPLEQCSPRVLPASPGSFDLGTGLLAGVNLGYALHKLRFEFEYFYRGQSGENLDLIVPGDEKQLEFVERSERIRDVSTDHYFVNAYFDFHGVNFVQATPYLGVGIGLMQVAVDYSAVSIRTDDVQKLRDLGRNSHAAGLSSLADSKLSDSLPGYQLIAGLDYAWSEQLTLGLKFRYGDSFGKFKDDDTPWNLLRDHEATVGPTAETGANLPVLYDIEGDGLGFWGVSLNLKYFY